MSSKHGKTRVVRRNSKKAALNADVVDNSHNFETPLSSSEPVPLRPFQLGGAGKMMLMKKTLFKSPRKDYKPSYHLGVTYNIRQSVRGANMPGSQVVVGTPSSSLQPMGTCRKCKHINLDHGHIKRRFLAKKETKSVKSSLDSKNNSKSAKNNSLGKQGKVGGFSTPEPRKNDDVDDQNSSFFLDSDNNITQQIKETIAISPYVRNYLEKKLKEKLKQQGQEGNSLWKQSIKNLKFRQSANLDELELVINLEQMAEGDADALPKEVEKPAGKTHTVRRRRPLRELSGKEGQELQTSIDIRKAAAVVSKMAGKENKLPPPEIKRQYFTRFKARTMKGVTTTTATTTTAQIPQLKVKQQQQPPPSNALSVFSTSTAVKMPAKQAKERRFVPQKTMTTRTMVKAAKAAPVASKAPAVVQSTCPRFTRRCQTLAANELINCGGGGGKVSTKVVMEGAPAGTSTTTTTRAPPIVPRTAVKTRMPRKSNIPVFIGGKTKIAFK